MKCGNAILNHHGMSGMTESLNTQSGPFSARDQKPAHQLMALTRNGGFSTSQTGAETAQKILPAGPQSNHPLVCSDLVKVDELHRKFSWQPPDEPGNPRGH